MAQDQRIIQHTMGVAIIQLDPITDVEKEFSIFQKFINEQNFDQRISSAQFLQEYSGPGLSAVLSKMYFDRMNQESFMGCIKQFLMKILQESTLDFQHLFFKIQKQKRQTLQELIPFEYLIGQEYEQFNRECKAQIQPTVCTTQITKEGVNFFRCLDCERIKTREIIAIYCYACFEPSKHSGHRYFMQQQFENGMGCCDCGDPEALNEVSFCEAHQHHNENFMKQNMEHLVFSLTRYRVSHFVQFLFHEWLSKFERVEEFLQFYSKLQQELISEPNQKLPQMAERLQAFKQNKGFLFNYTKYIINIFRTLVAANPVLQYLICEVLMSPFSLIIGRHKNLSLGFKHSCKNLHSKFFPEVMALKNDAVCTCTIMSLIFRMSNLLQEPQGKQLVEFVQTMFTFRPCKKLVVSTLGSHLMLLFPFFLLDTRPADNSSCIELVTASLDKGYAFTLKNSYSFMSDQLSELANMSIQFQSEELTNILLASNFIENVHYLLCQIACSVKHADLELKAYHQCFISLFGLIDKDYMRRAILLKYGIAEYFGRWVDLFLCISFQMANPHSNMETVMDFEIYATIAFLGFINTAFQSNKKDIDRLLNQMVFEQNQKLNQNSQDNQESGQLKLNQASECALENLIYKTIDHVLSYTRKFDLWPTSLLRVLSVLINVSNVYLGFDATHCTLNRCPHFIQYTDQNQNKISIQASANAKNAFLSELFLKVQVLTQGYFMYANRNDQMEKDYIKFNMSLHFKSPSFGVVDHQMKEYWVYRAVMQNADISLLQFCLSSIPFNQLANKIVKLDQFETGPSFEYKLLLCFINLLLNDTQSHLLLSYKFQSQQNDCNFIIQQTLINMFHLYKKMTFEQLTAKHHALFRHPATITKMMKAQITKVTDFDALTRQFSLKEAYKNTHFPYLFYRYQKAFGELYQEQKNKKAVLFDVITMGDTSVFDHMVFTTVQQRLLRALVDRKAGFIEFITDYLRFLLSTQIKPQQQEQQQEQELDEQFSLVLEMVYQMFIYLKYYDKWQVQIEFQDMPEISALMQQIFYLQKFVLLNENERYSEFRIPLQNILNLSQLDYSKINQKDSPFSNIEQSQDALKDVDQQQQINYNMLQAEDQKEKLKKVKEDRKSEMMKKFKEQQEKFLHKNLNTSQTQNQPPQLVQQKDIPHSCYHCQRNESTSQNPTGYPCYIQIVNLREYIKQPPQPQIQIENQQKQLKHSNIEYSLTSCHHVLHYECHLKLKQQQDHYIQKFEGLILSNETEFICELCKLKANCFIPILAGIVQLEKSKLEACIKWNLNRLSDALQYQLITNYASKIHQENIDEYDIFIDKRNPCSKSLASLINKIASEEKQQYDNSIFSLPLPIVLKNCIQTLVYFALHTLFLSPVAQHKSITSLHKAILEAKNLNQILSYVIHDRAYLSQNDYQNQDNSQSLNSFSRCLRLEELIQMVIQLISLYANELETLLPKFNSIYNQYLESLMKGKKQHAIEEVISQTKKLFIILFMILSNVPSQNQLENDKDESEENIIENLFRKEIEESQKNAINEYLQMRGLDVRSMDKLAQEQKQQQNQMNEVQRQQEEAMIIMELKQTQYHIFSLPLTFKEFHSKFFINKCQMCKSFPTFLSTLYICLICGQVTCKYCDIDSRKAETSHLNINNLVFHQNANHMGQTVYMNMQTCKTVLVQRFKRPVCIGARALYVDSVGGNFDIAKMDWEQVFLNQSMVETLEERISKHGLTQDYTYKIIKSIQNDQDNVEVVQHQ